MAAQTSTARRQTRAPARPAPRKPTLNANVVLYQNSVWLFAAFACAALVAFWPSYYSRLPMQPTLYAHAHGLTMTAWCAMLVAQAWLIRSGRRPLHRQIGAFSYILVPGITIATIAFVHVRMPPAPLLDSLSLYSLALMVNAVVAFLLIYGLAVYHRRQPAVHARYMLCTIFPLFTPITDRLIGRHVPAIVPLVPRIDGAPVVPVAGFILADLMLIALCIWDWRFSRRTNVFPIALAVLLLYHASVLTFHRLPFWRAFGEWFVGM
jgi:hypothetical protein